MELYRWEAFVVRAVLAAGIVVVVLDMLVWRTM